MLNGRQTKHQADRGFILADTAINLCGGTQRLTRAKKNAGDVQVFCLQFARRRRNVYFYCKQKREAA